MLLSMADLSFRSIMNLLWEKEAYFQLLESISDWIKKPMILASVLVFLILSPDGETLDSDQFAAFPIFSLVFQSWYTDRLLSKIILLSPSLQHDKRIYHDTLWCSGSNKTQDYWSESLFPTSTLSLLLEAAFIVHCMHSSKIRSVYYLSLALGAVWGLAEITSTKRSRVGQDVTALMISPSAVAKIASFRLETWSPYLSWIPVMMPEEVFRTIMGAFP